MKKYSVLLVIMIIILNLMACNGEEMLISENIHVDINEGSDTKDENLELVIVEPDEGEVADCVEEDEAEETDVVVEAEEALEPEEALEAEDALESVEVVDPTVNIVMPYSDVDYSYQEKVSSYENNPAINAKGIYINAHTAGRDKLDGIIELINETELNTLVIDVKDDDGSMLFYSEAANKFVPEANEKLEIKDIDAFMKRMKDNNIYTIARIVTFKSPLYAEKYPEYAITYKSSGNLYYADKAYWASPFDKNLWEYNVEVAKEALNVGFNEIQFDYVRFPATGSKLDKNLDFKNPNNNSKTFAVQNFVKYARNELSPLEGYIALDVFGWTATTINDSGIGQHWEGMSNVSDYMSPMVYPSHYGKGNFGLDVPDANPYKTIFESMSDSIERNENIETPAKLRPWLQAFTAPWVQGYIPYNTAEIQAQIQACKDLGIEDYIFWNSSNNYNKEWFDSN